LGRRSRSPAQTGQPGRTTESLLVEYTLTKPTGALDYGKFFLEQQTDMKSKALFNFENSSWFYPVAPDNSSVSRSFRSRCGKVRAALAILVAIPLAAVVLILHLLFPSEEHW